MLTSIQPPQFLRDYWQKRAFFEPAAAPGGLPQLEADEIAWLATLDDVESRLVLTERHGPAVRYRLENGPFDSERLGALPANDWTLLVQDVDKHLPEFRRWMEAFGFVPDWRIDDLMVSLAAPGGSVGPHRDNYDVFLCQGFGTREWLVGNPDDAVADGEAAGLALLLPFPEADRRLARDGDLLYLPPLMPHWGVAMDLCSTYSVGFRAPTRAELRLTAAEICAEPVFTADPSPADREIFYRDPDLQTGETDPGRISSRALGRIRKHGLVDACASDEQLARILGATVTDPKAWLAPEPLPAAEARRLCESAAPRRVHGMARLAWYRGAGKLLVFANGHCLETALGFDEFLESLCRLRACTAGMQEGLCADEPGRELHRWLAMQGVFDADETA